MIDLRAIIAEAGGIGLHGTDYDRATASLKAWHGGEPNDCGVFEEREVIHLAAVGRCKCEARVVKTGRGHWLAGYGYESPTWGGGGPASVWSRVAYETRDEAVRAIAGEMVERFSRLSVDRSSTVSDGVRRDAAKLVELLKAVIQPPAPKALQLDLFG
jgi:hypothetical protein